jgi:hypothetical protein
MTSEQHNKYLAYSFFAYAGFQVFWLLLMAAWMYFVFMVLPPGRPGGPEFPMAFFGVFVALMAVFQMIFTAPSLIAGYGLLKQKKWGRIAGIVGGITAAMSVPIGTAVCVYAMWFLLGDKGKEFYEKVTDVWNPGMLSEAEVPPWESEDIREAEVIREPRPSDWR